MAAGALGNCCEAGPDSRGACLNFFLVAQSKSNFAENGVENGGRLSIGVWESGWTVRGQRLGLPVQIVVVERVKEG